MEILKMKVCKSFQANDGDFYNVYLSDYENVYTTYSSCVSAGSRQVTESRRVLIKLSIVNLHKEVVFEKVYDVVSDDKKFVNAFKKGVEDFNKALEVFIKAELELCRMDIIMNKNSNEDETTEKPTSSLDDIEKRVAKLESINVVEELVKGMYKEIKPITYK